MVKPQFGAEAGDVDQQVIAAQFARHPAQPFEVGRTWAMRAPTGTFRAASVAPPTTPSVSRPWRAWNRRTAACRSWSKPASPAPAGRSPPASRRSRNCCTRGPADPVSSAGPSSTRGQPPRWLDAAPQPGQHVAQRSILRQSRRQILERGCRVGRSQQPGQRVGRIGPVEPSGRSSSRAAGRADRPCRSAGGRPAARRRRVSSSSRSAEAARGRRPGCRGRRARQQFGVVVARVEAVRAAGIDRRQQRVGAPRIGPERRETAPLVKRGDQRPGRRGAGADPGIAGRAQGLDPLPSASPVRPRRRRP